MNARHEAEGLKYGSEGSPTGAETLEFSSTGLGQRNPQDYPHPAEHPAMPPTLGGPMTIREVAELLGCSAWTVRQRYVPQGLPHLRTCASGKLVFFREQVIGWILKRQQQRQKGGQLR